MQERFEREAARLILKGHADFYGLTVAVCPSPASRPSLKFDPKFGYILRLPNDDREAWDGWARRALEILYERVICDAEND